MQGDVLAFYGGDGKVRITYEYDAWGNTISVKNADGVEITNKNSFAHLNPIRYRGYYYDTETGLYYLNSRYYDPEIGRFINADTTSVVKNSPMLITDKNLFAYCDNNPITREDSDGEFWETALDVVSLAFSVADVVKNPSDPWAWAGLVGDAIDLVPFVTGVGEITRGVKLTKKAVEAVDDVHDAAKVVDNVTDIARKIDFYVTPSRDAIPASRKAFDDNISKLIENNGKFYGNDSKGPVRIRIEKHESTPGYTGSYNPFHCEWHFHIDRRTKGSSGPFKKNYTGLLEWLS